MAITTTQLRSFLRKTTTTTTTTTAIKSQLQISRSRAGPPLAGRLVQQTHYYSPLPVRPTSKARKNQKKKLPLPHEQQQPPTWPTLPESIWSPTSAHSFPWTEYQSSTTVSPATAGVTNVATRECSSRLESLEEVLGADHPATKLLSQSALVMVRQLEMLNLLVGFEQANRYRILNPAGHTLGFLLEEQQGPWKGALQRQLLHTHRPIRASILDPHGHPILFFHRPFNLLTSKISVIDPISSDPHIHPRVIGESQQEFHLWRRRYNLFSSRPSSLHPNSSLHLQQFARIDAGFLAWHFEARDQLNKPLASISKDFTGFAREIFTDTGQYVLRFHPPNSLPLSTDQRAVILATAVSIDFDYFSHSHRGGLMPPIFFGGGSSSDGDF